MTTTDQSERTVQVGDFFEESWGYDQPNVDFYQVVKISASGKTIWMRHVDCACVRGGDGGPADYIAPIPDAFSDERYEGDKRGGLLKKLLKRSPTYRDWYVHMTSYSSAYLWDCKPAYQTGANWGH